jgi:hypothetical protein
MPVLLVSLAVATTGCGSQADAKVASPAAPTHIKTDPAPPKTTTVSGSLDMSTIVSTSVYNHTTCSRTGMKILVKDGSGSTVALAALAEGRVSHVMRGGGSLGYDCTWIYTADLTLTSPVYTFQAYVDGVDTIKPDERTAGAAELAGGKGPSLSLTFWL